MHWGKRPMRNCSNVGRKHEIHRGWTGDNPPDYLLREEHTDSPDLIQPHLRMFHMLEVQSSRGFWRFSVFQRRSSFWCIYEEERRRRRTRTRGQDRMTQCSWIVCLLHVVHQMIITHDLQIMLSLHPPVLKQSTQTGTPFWFFRFRQEIHSLWRMKRYWRKKHRLCLCWRQRVGIFNIRI